MRLKTQLLNKFRQFLVFETIDTVLANFLGKHPKSFILQKIIPGNSLYKKGSFRFCNRFGINYSLDLSDYPDWLLYFYSDSDSSMKVLTYANLGETVLDIGGNIGQTAFMLAQKVGLSGRVISFEPYPSTIAKFEANLMRNENIKNITLEKFGLGQNETVLTMYRALETNSGGNRIISSDLKKAEGMVEVRIKVLDDYLDNNGTIEKIDLIKIDVEGFEAEVLKGARLTLLKYKPALFIEINDEMLRKQNSSSDEVLNIIREIDYIITDVSNMKILSKTDKLNNHTDIYCSKK